MRSAVLIGSFVIALCGCASRSISFHSVPSEDPAAENAAAVASAAAFAAAAASAAESEAKSEAGKSVPETAPPPVTPADAPSMYTYDPWERINRFTYRFNARFDEAVFLRVSNAYRRVPSPIRSGVHNFFGNLSEIDSVVNYMLQWRLKLGLRSLGRFVINSTVGIGGLFDAAARFKLPGAPTGLSTTLAKWGMHPGPYLVIPLLGPSTLRDGLGFLGDYGTSYGIDIAGAYRGDVSWGLGVVNAVDQRSNISFRYYSTGSPFEYENIRFLYVRKRLIEDEGLRGKVQKGVKSTTQLPSAARNASISEPDSDNSFLKLAPSSLIRRADGTPCKLSSISSGCSR
jgi:phospholipid-binding lipoprotein MlaA